MQNYMALVSYDGTRYNGWQKQKSTKNTIQGIMEEILKKMTGSECEVIGSGRTDAGAHASGQVINFHIDTDMNESDITEYFNRYLPTDICVLSCRMAEERFHSRLNAKKKTYEYNIWTSPIKNVFERNYLFHSPKSLDVEKMKHAAGFLLGEHDFLAFSSLKKTNKSTVRKIYYIDIERKESRVSIKICGNGFLYNMVRIISGTLIEVGEGKRNPEDILEALKSRNRENAGFTAPAKGLILLNVEY